MDKTIKYDGKDFKNMYMTSFLSLLGEKISSLKPVFINNGRMEVDCPDDLNHFNYFLK